MSVDLFKMPDLTCYTGVALPIKVKKFLDKYKKKEFLETKELLQAAGFTSKQTGRLNNVASGLCRNYYVVVCSECGPKKRYWHNPRTVKKYREANK